MKDTDLNNIIDRFKNCSIRESWNAANQLKEYAHFDLTGQVSE